MEADMAAPEVPGKVMSIDGLVELAITELSPEQANKAIKQVSNMADEASGRFDKLTKFFIAGVTAANAAGLSAALGEIRGDLDSKSPLVISAVLFAAGLTIALVNPLLNLARDWIEQRRINREYVELLKRNANEKPLKLFELMYVIKHALSPWWFSPARFTCNALATSLFVGGVWWPIIGILTRLLR
jgi:hypothetical protein